MENSNAQRSSLITYSHHLLPCGPPSFFTTLVYPQKENESAVTRNIHVGLSWIMKQEERKLNSSHRSPLSIRTACSPIKVRFCHFAENQSSGITEMALTVN